MKEMIVILLKLMGVEEPDFLINRKGVKFKVNIIEKGEYLMFQALDNNTAIVEIPLPKTQAIVWHENGYNNSDMVDILANYKFQLYHRYKEFKETNAKS